MSPTKRGAEQEENRNFQTPAWATFCWGAGVLSTNSFAGTSTADLCHSAKQAGAILGNRRQAARLGLNAKGKRGRRLGGSGRRAQTPAQKGSPPGFPRCERGGIRPSLLFVDPPRAACQRRGPPLLPASQTRRRTAVRPAQPLAPGTNGPPLACGDSQVDRLELKSAPDTC